MIIRAVAMTLGTAFVAVAFAKSTLLFSTTHPSTAEPSEVSDSAPVEATAAEEPVRDRNRQVALRRDGSGHFFTPAVVNGRSVEFLVDTGATYVALSEDTARRLGYRPHVGDEHYMVSTANGTMMVSGLTLREIRVGGISVRNVEAMVVPGDALDGNLLGMSFLNRLRSFSVEGEQLVMRK